MPRVVNKLLPGTLISYQRARHVAVLYTKSLVEHVMLIRCCAACYTDQLVDEVLETCRTRRADRLLHIEEFKSKLKEPNNVPPKGEIRINVRSCTSGDVTQVSFGKKWPISWSRVYQSVRDVLEVPRAVSMWLWFENQESVCDPSAAILSLSSRYISRIELKRTLIYLLEPLDTESESFEEVD